MATNGNACTVTVEIDPKGLEITRKSAEMRKLLKVKAAEVVAKKEELAKDYLHGPMPNNGLYGYRIRKGDVTLYAVIHPTSPPGYYIARKHGTL